MDTRDCEREYEACATFMRPPCCKQPMQYAGKCPIRPYPLDPDSSAEEDADTEGSEGSEGLEHENARLRLRLEWNAFMERHGERERRVASMHHVPRALLLQMLRAQRKNFADLVDQEWAAPPDEPPSGTLCNRRLLADVLDAWIEEAVGCAWAQRDLRNERRCIRRRLKRRK
jgi:hypothetical protein